MEKMNSSCCLSSVNLEKWDEWSGESIFIEDIMRFLDNILMISLKILRINENAVYSANELCWTGCYGFS